jgi:hypothetical protein
MAISHHCRWYVMAGAAAAVAACGDPSASVSPHTVPTGPPISHAATGLLDCEVTIESGLLRAIGASAPKAPTIECSPSPDSSSGGEGFDHRLFASDTILERFADIGFVYGTPTWSVIAGTGAMTVSISVVNHIAKPLGTSDGVTPAPNGTRVFIMSGPTVITCSGLCVLPTVTVTNSTGTGTFTTTGQMYFEYSGIIQPDSASAAVTWDFTIVDASKFNFQVGVDAITP